MTNSRSKASTSASWLAVLILVLVAGTAEAGRKRVVILDFDGDKAEKFHDDMVKLVKKNYTVVPTDKWNGTAEELEATRPVEKDYKKVAKKLKVDAIITGKIEKRRDEYLIHLKLRAGASGDVSKPVETKSSGPRIDGKASTDIKDELLGAIDSLDDGGGGKADDSGDDDKPKTKKKDKIKKDDDAGDDETPKPKKKDKVKKVDDSGDDAGDDDQPKHKGFSKKSDDMKGADKVKKTDKADKKDDDSGDDAPQKKDKTKDKKIVKKDDDSGDDETPKPKKKDKDKDKKVEDSGDDNAGNGDDDKPKKKVAKKDDDGGEVDAGAETPAGMVDPEFALSPGGRAIDATVGLSVTARRMSFKSDPTINNPPPGYKGVPVAGGIVDATVYPLAIGHKSNGMLSNLGLVFTFDRVLHISSKTNFLDSMGQQQSATLETASQRFSVGAAFRYPIGTTANAPVVGAQLRYGQNSFLIAQTIPGTMTSSDIPNVTYTSIEPSANIHYPATSKITLNANVGVQVITGTGGIGTSDQYGAASVLGVEGDVGGDYMVTKNIFARAAFHADTIGLTFKGTGTQTMRGGMTPVVSGARDTYLGGMVSVGYVY